MKVDFQVLISVIVPVYNCEQYIETCLRSIEKQTYLNFEIICIDDDSQDSSREVVERCLNSMQLKNVFIKNDVNRGVGYARNCGLKRASGDLVVFVDGDDYIDVHMIEYMYKAISENDKIDYATVPYRVIYDGAETVSLIAKQYNCRVILPEDLLKKTTAVWGEYSREV